MTSPLTRALNTIHTLGYDDLRDLCDCIDYRLEGHAARHGRTPSIDVLIHNLTLDDPPSSPLAQAFHAMQAIPVHEDCLDDLKALRLMVSTLGKALAPQEQRRDGRGYITTRSIPRLKHNKRTGRWEIKTYGPYAYLRRWATGGNRDRKRQILKSYYLGKDIALLYLTENLSGEEIITAFDNDDLVTLQENAKQRVNVLPDSTFLMHEPPAVDFDPAPELLTMMAQGLLKAADMTRIYSTAILEGLTRRWITQHEVYEHYNTGTLDMLKAALTQRLDAEAKDRD